MSGKSRIAREALFALLACLPALLLAGRGASAPVSATLGMGPNESGYLSGFDPFFEAAEGLATRWTTYHARVALPLQARDASLTVGYRLARMLPETAVVDVLLHGRVIDRFRCRGGAWVERAVSVPSFDGPLDLAFEVDSHDRRGMGVRLDWVRVEVRAGRLTGRGLPLAAPSLLCLGVLLLLRYGGCPRTFSSIAAGGLGAGMLIWGRLDPLALAHVSTALLAPALALGGVAVLVGRRLSGGAWLAPAVLTAYLLRGALVFHPAFFYPDVQNHARYVRAFAEAQGGVVERGIAAQVKVATAYPRYVAGKAYAFPYSPLFFVPFTWLGPNPAPVEDALRHVGLAAGALETLVVFLLAGALAGPGAAVAAAAASAVLPPLLSRSLLAMWPTLAGHLLDLAAIGAALAFLRNPQRWRSLVLLALATLAALLTYISSLFNLGAFLALLALLDRKRAGRLLGVLVATSAATMLLLYASFTRTFVLEILPAVLTGAGAPQTATATAPGSTLLAALGRVPMFFGWGYPALAVAGLVLLWRRGDGPARAVTGAYALAFAVLVSLRGLLPGLFRDLKEVEFVAPLVALGAGVSLAELWTRGRGGRVAALLLAVGLVAFSAEKAQTYFLDYRPAYMVPPPRLPDLAGAQARAAPAWLAPAPPGPGPPS